MRGSGEQDAAGTAYLLGAGVLYQRWAAATAPYHLPQNTGRRSHTEGRGALPTQPQASNLPQGQAAGQALTWTLGGEWGLVSFWEQFRGFCAKTEKGFFFFWMEIRKKKKIKTCQDKFRRKQESQIQLGDSQGSLAREQLMPEVWLAPDGARGMCKSCTCWCRAPHTGSFPQCCRVAAHQAVTAALAGPELWEGGAGCLGAC